MEHLPVPLSIMLFVRAKSRDLPAKENATAYTAPRKRGLRTGNTMRKYRNILSKGRASKRETRRADELYLLQKLGEISDLEEQVKYELIPKQEGERAVTYTADFRYKDKQGKIHVEDVKSPITVTPVYVVKRKLMLWVHAIRIEEV